MWEVTRLRYPFGSFSFSRFIFQNTPTVRLSHMWIWNCIGTSHTANILSLFPRRMLPVSIKSLVLRAFLFYFSAARTSALPFLPLFFSETWTACDVPVQHSNILANCHSYYYIYWLKPVISKASIMKSIVFSASFRPLIVVVSSCSRCALSRIACRGAVLFHDGLGHHYVSSAHPCH